MFSESHRKGFHLLQIWSSLEPGRLQSMGSPELDMTEQTQGDSEGREDWCAVVRGVTKSQT